MNTTQIAAMAKEWAADDRKWNTQEVVERNLIAFAEKAMREWITSTPYTVPRSTRERDHLPYFPHRDLPPEGERIGPSPYPPDPKPAHASEQDLLDLAWGIIANAGGGDWTKESQEWQEAARKWRDRYKVLPAAHAGEPIICPTCNQDMNELPRNSKYGDCPQCGQGLQKPAHASEQGADTNASGIVALVTDRQCKNDWQQRKKAIDAAMKEQI